MHGNVKAFARGLLRPVNHASTGRDCGKTDQADRKGDPCAKRVDVRLDTMPDFVGFFAAVVIISASGVMAPGPLFVSTISSAIQHGKNAGLKIAMGHTVVELPLVILIGIGAIIAARC